VRRRLTMGEIESFPRGEAGLFINHQAAGERDRLTEAKPMVETAKGASSESLRKKKPTPVVVVTHGGAGLQTSVI
jgi:hypothetical protein